MDFFGMFVPVFVATVGPIAVAAVKKYGPKVPKLLMPVLAASLGAAAGYLTNLGAEQGGLLGLAGVGVREIVDQVKKAVSEL